MGRPKEFKSETVIKAATDCFWDAGVRGTSISSLVEAMNIQRSSFYNSFKSRDAIYGQVLTGYMSECPLSGLMIDGENNEVATPDLAILDLVLDFSEFLIERGNGRGCLFFNGLAELRKEDGLAYELLQDHYARLTERLAALLDQLDKESQPNDSLGRLDLHQFLTLLIGISHYSKRVQNAERIKAIALDQIASLSPHFAQLIAKQAEADIGFVENMKKQA